METKGDGGNNLKDRRGQQGYGLCCWLSLLASGEAYRGGQLQDGQEETPCILCLMSELLLPPLPSLLLSAFSPRVG